MANIYIALVHFPVYNKNGETVATSITTIDVHDISRVGKTYGISKYFLVTPIKSHIDLAYRMISHWREGYGASYNPTRRDALELIEPAVSIDDVIVYIKDKDGALPIVVATCAKSNVSNISFNGLRERLKTDSSPYLILFGTGWGLHKDVMDRADLILDPIDGIADFNHLSVRSAAAIIIDRLIGH